MANGRHEGLEGARAFADMVSRLQIRELQEHDPCRKGEPKLCVWGGGDTLPFFATYLASLSITALTSGGGIISPSGLCKKTDRMSNTWTTRCASLV